MLAAEVACDGVDAGGIKLSRDSDLADDNPAAMSANATTERDVVNEGNRPRPPAAVCRPQNALPPEAALPPCCCLASVPP